MIIRKKEKKVNFYDGKTERSGLDMYVLSSGFQKSIRRGLLSDAFSYTTEIIESGNIDFLWKRIFTIIVEDIGLANIYIGKLIGILYSKHKASDNGITINDDFLYQAVALLTLSKKSRECDNFYHLIHTFDYKLSDEDKKFFLEFCDTNFYKGKGKKNRIELFKKLDGYFRGKIDSEIIDSYQNIFSEFNLIGLGSEINLYSIFLYLIEKYNINWIEDEYKNYLNDIKKIDIKINRLHLSKIIPEDYVFDKHTLIGKKMGRGIKHFFEIGSKIENENDKYNIYSKLIKRINNF